MFLPEAVFSVALYLVLTVILAKCYLTLTIRPFRSDICLVGKTAIVTGGNRGIGFQVALGLASRGCRVIIACRSSAEKSKKEIIKRTHNANILTRHLDLASLESVREFCKKIHESEEKIDILINNAGIGAEINRFTKDGLHPTMQVNLFGPFLLTHLLIDLLKKPQHSRIIFVSSLLSFLNNLTLENLNVGEVGELSFFDTLRIYANSKVGGILVANELAERLEPFGITSNSLHPGAVRTDIFDDIRKMNYLNVLSRSIFWLIRQVFFRPVEDGAHRCLQIAVSDTYEHETGTFLWLLTSFTPSIVSNKAFRKSVWERIEDYVKLKQDEKIPEIHKLK